MLNSLLFIILIIRHINFVVEKLALTSYCKKRPIKMALLCVVARNEFSSQQLLKILLLLVWCKKFCIAAFFKEVMIHKSYQLSVCFRGISIIIIIGSNAVPVQFAYVIMREIHLFLRKTQFI